MKKSSKTKGIKVVGPATRGDALEAEKKGFRKGKSAYSIKTNRKSFGKKSE
jgi:hypothetical protein